MLGIKNAFTITVWGIDVRFLTSPSFYWYIIGSLFAALLLYYSFFLYWFYTLIFQCGDMGCFIFFASDLSLSKKTLALLGAWTGNSQTEQRPQWSTSAVENPCITLPATRVAFCFTPPKDLVLSSYLI